MKHIETLIQRYLDGNTSVAEEHELRSFFKTADVPEGLKKYAPLFGWQDEADDIGGGFDDIFAQSVDEVARPRGVRRFVPSRKVWWSAAACVAVIASAVIFLDRPETDAPRPMAQVRPTATTAVEGNSSSDTATISCAATCHVAKTPVETAKKTTPATAPTDVAEPAEADTETFSDPTAAYEEAQKALLLLSDNLNKGFEAIENANISNS